MKCVSLLFVCALALPTLSYGQQAAQTYEPKVGQAGKDVVWVPTPPELVEKMLDMAKVTPQDFVMDLGSGDGRNIIAAAKRGARAVGVEYTPEMVEFSNRKAAEAGVAGKATFVRGDMYEADISKATVMALFLLPDNLARLKPKFLALKPGSRLVLNTFAIPEWTPDEEVQIEGDCSAWCTSLLYIVPAQVAGTWALPSGELTLKQDHQILSGTLTTGGKSVAITNGKVRGEEISFTVDGTEYTGRLAGDRITGSSKTGTNAREWIATRGR